MIWLMMSAFEGLRGRVSENLYVIYGSCQIFSRELPKKYTCYHSLSRLDSGTLLQRYNPVPDSQGSATLHRSASLFSGYSAANRDNYLSVAVKFVSSTKDLVTVRIQKKADVNPVVDP